MSTWADDLTDKVAVITGGAGVGRALAARLLAADMRVVVADVEARAIAEAVDALGGGDRVFGVDERCPFTGEHGTHARRDARAVRLHVVCLNAGVAPVGPLLETPPEVWDWVFDVNVRGVVYGALTFAPILADQGQGHVVCTASIAGFTDTPKFPPYGVSKHAVVGLAGAMRRELAKAMSECLSSVPGSSGPRSSRVSATGPTAWTTRPRTT